jgi:hypothetical protein
MNAMNTNTYITTPDKIREISLEIQHKVTGGAPLYYGGSQHNDYTLTAYYAGNDDTYIVINDGNAIEAFPVDHWESEEDLRQWVLDWMVDIGLPEEEVEP